MKKLFIIGLLGFVGFSSFITDFDFSCIELPSTPYNYANIEFPVDINITANHFDNMPADNPTTDLGATLGRVLFYDVDLSRNRTISCASCHKQELSFADTAFRSVGFDGGLTHRNSMSLNHTRFRNDTTFFWDGRAASIEIQSLMPMQDEVEMGMTLEEVVSRIEAKPFYGPLFEAAFGTPEVTTDRIAKAIAQFERSMNTFGSKFRTGMTLTANSTPGGVGGAFGTVPFTNFTDQENLGKTLFFDKARGNCQSCHSRSVMVQPRPENIGLDSVGTTDDLGFGAVSGFIGDDRKFVVPTLINVALTAPYMHDGRHKTLEEVINFYSDSVKNDPNLSHFLKDSLNGNKPRKPHYTDEEKAALKAFMLTLTDTVILTDVRWSNPFCRPGGTVAVIFTSPLSAYRTVEGIQVDWGTSAEINSDRFEIERSTDGTHFSRIGDVKAKGKSSVFSLYNFVDKHPAVGTNFYRIRAIDLSGKPSFSKVVSAKYDLSQLLIYPNPVVNTVNIQTNTLYSRVFIVNALGKTIKVINSPVKTVDISDLPTGMYFIKVMNGDDQLVTEKIIKK